MNNELSTTVDVKSQKMSIFNNMKSFAQAQKMAEMLSKSNIVPSNYQGNIANTMVALELAQRVGVSPIMVMQNLDIIKGKPSWSSTFIIAVLNSCGRFSQLRFRMDGEGQNYGCTAYATDLDTGKTLESPKVTLAMVHAEGWINKMGSKWKTMPELMYRYRAASFFGRIFASDILKGMQSAEEVIDVVAVDVTENNINKSEERKRILSFLNKANTIKKLNAIKSQLKGEGLEAEYEADLEDAEMRILHAEETNE